MAFAGYVNPVLAPTKTGSHEMEGVDRDNCLVVVRSTPLRSEVSLTPPRPSHYHPTGPGAIGCATELANRAQFEPLVRATCATTDSHGAGTRPFAHLVVFVAQQPKRFACLLRSTTPTLTHGRRPCAPAAPLPKTGDLPIWRRYRVRRPAGW